MRFKTPLTLFYVNLHHLLDDVTSDSGFILQYKEESIDVFARDLSRGASYW